MSVDRATVAKIASLARIRMGEDELDRMAPEFNGILAWVEQLGEVDTSGVEPMTAVIPQRLRLRDDVVDADPLTGGDRNRHRRLDPPARRLYRDHRNQADLRPLQPLGHRRLR